MILDIREMRRNKSPQESHFFNKQNHCHDSWLFVVEKDKQYKIPGGFKDLTIFKSEVLCNFCSVPLQNLTGGFSSTVIHK